MGKKRLIVSYEIDFNLYGLIATIKDYKLAWLLNKALNIHFVKEPDLTLDFVSGGRLVLCNYYHQSEHFSIRLIKNKDVEQTGVQTNYLIPEMNNFDFVLQIKGIDQFMEIAQLEKTIRSISEVEYLAAIDTGKLKSKENLIFE